LPLALVRRHAFDFRGISVLDVGKINVSHGVFADAGGQKIVALHPQVEDVLLGELSRLFVCRENRDFHLTRKRQSFVAVLHVEVMRQTVA
jgi:hypothetical protein